MNDYADVSPPSGTPTYCGGGTVDFNPPPPFDLLYGTVIPCYFNSFGNRIEGNLFVGNGFFGNATNGDLANAALAYPIDNCFKDNFDLLHGAPSSSPAKLQNPAVAGVCGKPWNPDPQQNSFS